MTIGIDIRVLSRGTRTGIEEYTINLLDFLLPLDKSINYKLFYNGYRKIELNYSWANLDNVEIKKFRFPNNGLFLFNRWARWPKIDRLLGGVDIFFNPHFFIAPVSLGCKKTVTFHDLSFELYPQLFSLSKRVWQKILMNTKKDENLKNFTLVSDRISANKQNSKILEIKKKYHLPNKFILYFGTIEPRKNLIGLIKTFEKFKKSYEPQITNYKLVIAGKKGWLYKNVLKTAKRSHFSKEIILTDFINNEDKAYLYNLASLFVYPSFYEGFGFPPLEAMVCGLPVITSNLSSLPEIVGKAAIMINPYNIDEFAWAMYLLLKDKNLRKRLIKEGTEQVKKFRWKRCAEETLNVLKNLK